MNSQQFMRHGHEMLWFLRMSFSESELPLSYNKSYEYACADSIDRLRDEPFEQGMTYIYRERDIEIFTKSNEKAWAYETWQT